jgi:hypothetical protein
MLLSVLVTGAPWVIFDALTRAQISLDFASSSRNFSSISLIVTRLYQFHDIEYRAIERADLVFTIRGVVSIALPARPDSLSSQPKKSTTFAVSRRFAWTTRWRRLAKDDERYAQTLAGFHIVAFVCLMLKRAAELMLQGA